MWVRRGGWGLVALALALTPSGCGGSKPVPVEVLVTLDGQPVSGATVLFVPVEGRRGHWATGLTYPDGTAQLSTFEEEDGALPGEYDVVVTRSEGRIDQPQGKRSSPERAHEHYERVLARGEKKPLLPAVYAEPATTPLHCTVPVEGRVVLELKSTVER
jgi:hypothetical protein